MNLEETILFTITMAFTVNIYLFMAVKMLMDWVDWRIECKHLLSKANGDYCMCGDLIHWHSMAGGHAPLSELEWARENKPKLELGEW